MTAEEWNEATPAKGGKKKKIDTDRLPPNSLEAEQGVLGCILLAPVEALDSTQGSGVQPEWFYDLRNQTIYHRISRMAATGVAVDILTLQAALKDAGELDQVGGLGYLAGLPDLVPSAANIDYYVDILREKWTARAVIKLFVEATSELSGADGANAAIALNKVFREVEALNDGTTQRRSQSLKELMPELIDDLEDYHRGSAQIRGLTTGFDYLDKILGGFGGKHGNLLVMAARPGVGKSALGMQIAAHVAMTHKWFTPKLDETGKPVLDPGTNKPAEWVEHHGLPVGVFSLEMSGEELLRRLLFMSASVDAQRFKTGFADGGDLEKLALASVGLCKAPIWIDEDDSLTIDELAARARLMVRQHGIKLFIVDYIQCLQVTAKRFRQDRVQEMAEISNGLRRLAKQLDTPFIVLAQMNREFSKEKGIRVPRLEDLRDSGAIEQDAHVVMFLYKDELNKNREEAFEQEVSQVYGAGRMSDWSARPQLMKLLVAKNRHGMSNKAAELLFEGSSTKFEDYYAWRKRHGLQAQAKGEPKQAPKTEVL